MTNRDEFPDKIKKALALRAQYRCSFRDCQRLTVGPSDESDLSVNMIGKAAHISAAAPGGPRFNATMTREQRIDIANGIWLCATHADLVDGDVVTYTAPDLQVMKTAHEARCREELARQETASQIQDDLVAIGSDIVAIARIHRAEQDAWSFQLRNFVQGDIQTLVAFIGRAASADCRDSFVLANAFDDGRVLAAPPILSSGQGGNIITCPIRPSFLRINAHSIGTDLALSDDNDLFLKNGDFATVKGVDVLPQRIRICLSTEQGEMHFHPEYGTRLRAYYALMLKSPWLSHMFKLEVIKQASIPLYDSMQRRAYTSLLAVERVRSIKVLADAPVNDRLPIRIHLDVKGVGEWLRDTWIYMPSANANGSSSR